MAAKTTEVTETETAEVTETETAEVTEKRHTISIDDVKYYIDSLPQEAHNLLNHIQIIDDQAVNWQTQKTIAELAKQKLINDLSQLKEQFEVCED